MKTSEAANVRVDIRITAIPIGLAWRNAVQELLRGSEFPEATRTRTVLALTYEDGFLHAYSSGGIRIAVRATTARVPEWLKQFLDRITSLVPDQEEPLLRPVSIAANETGGEIAAKLVSAILSCLADKGIFPELSSLQESQRVTTFGT